MAISLEAVIRLRDEFSSKMKKATDKAKDFVKNAEGWKKAENNIKNVGGALTKYVTTPLAGVGTTAVMTVSSFDDSMSQVQAISGATGEEFEKLREMAKELGATTRFSASEAADGMTFLAMAGFDTQEVMATMPGLLDLAAASGMELGRAADIASNVLSGFGLEAAEAGRVSDVLAAGASNANTSVEQLGDAMAVVAPVANTLGLDIEELTAAVGFMSDAGIQGSQAGRMLRQGLLRLASPTGEAADLIDELGINVFDAEGNMKSLDQVVAELENGLDGMSSQAQAAALSTLFGSESVAGWSAVLERGSGDLAEFTSELQGSEGAAANMAETMEDNIGGAFREMRSAIEGLLIAIGDELKPYVQDIAEVIGDWARKFTELDDSTKKIIISVGAFAAAIGPAAIALSTIISVGRNLITVFRGLAIAKGLFSAALWASPITWIIAGIVALIAAGVWLVRNWDTVKEKAGELWSFIKGVWDKLVGWTKQTFSNIWNSIKQTWDDVWGKTKEIWNNVKTSIGQAMDFAKRKVKGFFSPLLNFISRAKGAWDKLVGALKNFKLPEPVRKITSGVGNFVGGLIPGAYHGEDYVPRDNMLYRLHKGEMVLPRQEAEAYRNFGGNVGVTPSPIVVQQQAQGKGDIYVTITGNDFHVRNETDIKAVGDALADRIESRLNRGTA